MTQQPYAPQGYPPQQPFQQPQYQPPMQPQYQAPQYAQPQGYAPPQAPPTVPLANGSIDEFYAQPSLGGGPGISWKGKPDGYTVQGVVSRDVTNGDISQEVGAPNTAEAGKPQFYRDGRRKFVMSIPLSVAPSQEFPEGEAKLYIRGQLRDELSRAMAEAQAGTTPAGGATITVTLVQRKQGRGAIPQNIFAVVYTPAGHPAPAIQQPAPQQYAQPQQPVQQPQYAPQPAPQQQYAQPAPQQQYAQPAPQQFAPQPAQQQQQYQAPAVQPVADAQVPQMVPAAAPVQQQQPMAPQPPAGLSDVQQGILSQLQAG